MNIQREEKVAQKQVRDAAKRNDMQSAKVLARELVRTRKAITQMYTQKAHIISMSTQLSEQLAIVKVAGTLQKSTEVMKLVNDLIKAPQLNQTVQQMSKEMMKAGVIDEMMDDAIEGAIDSDDIEEETDAEVDKVLQEIAGETVAQMAAAPKAKRRSEAAPATEEGATEEEPDSLQELQARLDAVRS
ncbi:hypothetical protein WJX84_005192 [Apatococcus fuscideae]